MRGGMGGVAEYTALEHESATCALRHTKQGPPPSLRKGDDLLQDSAGEVLVPGDRALPGDDLNARGALSSGRERDSDFAVRCGTRDLPLVLASFLLRCGFRLPDPELAERLLGRGRGALDRGCDDRLHAALREVDATARAGSGGGKKTAGAGQHSNGNERCLHVISNALALLPRPPLNTPRSIQLLRCESSRAERKKKGPTPLRVTCRGHAPRSRVRRGQVVACPHRARSASRSQ